MQNINISLNSISVSDSTDTFENIVYFIIDDYIEIQSKSILEEEIFEEMFLELS